MCEKVAVATKRTMEKMKVLLFKFKANERFKWVAMAVFFLERIAEDVTEWTLSEVDPRLNSGEISFIF